MKNGSGPGAWRFTSLRSFGFPTKIKGKTARTSEAEMVPQRGAAEGKNTIFIECFAGKGDLSKAVSRLGIPTEEPQDLQTGGIDFSNDEQLLALWKHWRYLRDSGFALLVHFAPPCCTFSRARDRSRKTRLRSLASPAGLFPENVRTQQANLIAKNTALSIKFLVHQLGAQGTMEQPSSSYMLPFLDQEGLLIEHNSVLLHQCRYGRPYRKPTVFLTFGGLDMSTLARTCTKSSSCGRSFHVSLGFGDSSTAEAAAYPAGLCAAYAGAVARHVAREDDDQHILEQLEVTDKGVVRRHVARGDVAPSAKAIRARADADSRAG